MLPYNSLNSTQETILKEFLTRFLRLIWVENKFRMEDDDPSFLSLRRAVSNPNPPNDEQKNAVMEFLNYLNDKKIIQFDMVFVGRSWNGITEKTRCYQIKEVNTVLLEISEPEQQQLIADFLSTYFREQTAQVLQNFLNDHFLSAIEAQENIQVSVMPNKLVISMPDLASEQSRKLVRLINYLKTAFFLDCTFPATAPYDIHVHSVNPALATVLNNPETNSSLLDSFARTAPPASVEKKAFPHDLRSQISELVAQNWAKFNGELQQHIIDTIRSPDVRIERLRKLDLDERPNRDRFDSYECPIKLGIPKISVHLPIPSQTDIKCFDLEHVLQIESLKHPITGKPVTLEQIMPISTARLTELEKRLNDVEEKEQQRLNAIELEKKEQQRLNAIEAEAEAEEKEQQRLKAIETEKEEQPEQNVAPPSIVAPNSNLSSTCQFTKADTYRALDELVANNGTDFLADDGAFKDGNMHVLPCTYGSENEVLETLKICAQRDREERKGTGAADSYTRRYIQNVISIGSKGAGILKERVLSSQEENKKYFTNRELENACVEKAKILPDSTIIFASDPQSQVSPTLSPSPVPSSSLPYLGSSADEGQTSTRAKEKEKEKEDVKDVLQDLGSPASSSSPSSSKPMLSKPQAVSSSSNISPRVPATILDLTPTLNQMPIPKKPPVPQASSFSVHKVALTNSDVTVNALSRAFVSLASKPNNKFTYAEHKDGKLGGVLTSTVPELKPTASGDKTETKLVPIYWADLYEGKAGAEVAIYGSQATGEGLKAVVAGFAMASSGHESLPVVSVGGSEVESEEDAYKLLSTIVEMGHVIPILEAKTVLESLQLCDRIEEKKESEDKFNDHYIQLILNNRELRDELERDLHKELDDKRKRTPEFKFTEARLEDYLMTGIAEQRKQEQTLASSSGASRYERSFLPAASGSVAPHNRSHDPISPSPHCQSSSNHTPAFFDPVQGGSAGIKPVQQPVDDQENIPITSNQY